MDYNVVAQGMLDYKAACIENLMKFVSAENGATENKEAIQSTLRMIEDFEKAYNEYKELAA